MMLADSLGLEAGQGISLMVLNYRWCGEACNGGNFSCVASRFLELIACGFDIRLKCWLVNVYVEVGEVT